MAPFGGSKEKLLENEAAPATDETIEGPLPTDDLTANTVEEKRFLLLIERGDTANVKRLFNFNESRCFH